MRAVREALGKVKQNMATQPDPAVKYGMSLAVDPIEEALNVPGSSAEEGTGHWGGLEESKAYYNVCEATLRRWKRNNSVKWKQPGGPRGKVYFWIAD